MLYIGCDLHTRFQQVAMLDTDTGEIVERRLEHENTEAQAFYTSLTPPQTSSPTCFTFGLTKITSP